MQLSENCLNCTPSALGFEAECTLRNYNITTLSFTHVNGYIEFGGANQMIQYKIKRHQFCSLEYSANNIAGDAVYSMNICKLIHMQMGIFDFLLQLLITHRL